jgi:hypothetical protein
MNQGRRRTLWTLAIWSVVAIGFGVTVFAYGGPATYVEGQTRRLVGAVFLAIGFFGTPLMLFLTRARPGSAHVASDERDERISHRATMIGLVVVLLYVFLTCIGLWEAYSDAGAVPVGWMWFLAYSTAILSYLGPATAALMLDFGMLRRAEG